MVAAVRRPLGQGLLRWSDGTEELLHELLVAREVDLHGPVLHSGERRPAHQHEERVELDVGSAIYLLMGTRPSDFPLGRLPPRWTLDGSRALLGRRRPNSAAMCSPGRRAASCEALAEAAHELLPEMKLLKLIPGVPAQPRRAGGRGPDVADRRSGPLGPGPTPYRRQDPAWPIQHLSAWSDQILNVVESIKYLGGSQWTSVDVKRVNGSAGTTQ